MCDGEILKAFPLIMGKTQGYLFSLILFTTVLCTGDPSLYNKARKRKGLSQLQRGKKALICRHNWVYIKNTIRMTWSKWIYQVNIGKSILYLLGIYNGTENIKISN